MRRTLATLLVVSLAACTGVEKGPNGTTTKAPTSVLEVTTSLPNSTTSTTTTTHTLEPTEMWNLLYIQDSLGFGVAELYGERIHDALGVTVEVDDKAIGDLSAANILKFLTDDAAGWATRVRIAEVIVIFGNPNGSGATSDIGTCISDSTAERDPPTQYSADDWQPYRELLDEVYSRIWEIREGEPVILRAVDFLNPVISAWRQAGIETECNAALESLNAVVREAAVANGATLVSLHDWFNGPAHDQDPRDKGWIGPDGIHMSPEGKDAIADALAAAGFEPNIAPTP